jgi:hypothetical protein
MPTPFWRSETTQDQLNQLDRPGFAVEFLRRNPNYRNDCLQTQQRIAQGELDAQAAEAALAHRWGLRFCP